MFSHRKNCPGCNGTSRKEVFNTPYTDPLLSEYLSLYYNRATKAHQKEWLANGNFCIAECNECKLIFQAEIPDDQFMGELYGNWLGVNDPLAPHQPQMPLGYYAYTSAELLQIMAYMKEVGLPEGRPKILDFGMGWSNWAQIARGFGADVSGIELSPGKLAHARSLGFRVEESLASFDARSFDFINTEQVVEHIAEPAKIVSELVKLLRPNGILKLSVPDGAGIIDVLKDWNWSGAIQRKEQLMPVQPLEHINCFTAESLDRLAAQNGMARIALPLRIAYSYPADWFDLKSIVKGMLRPVKRNTLGRGCYALYRIE
ncbi:MAG: class I SAM-dependent methyltransferase [Methyloversatilis sp.]|uniref:class I SAM-dependent methyltransferase n=1 Tax=Methyloversatilis sp. TaxID=2569862 RepID=UPI00273476FD|nr:class I SAM-dependent methyltransferase [Methyloversatilis sp.]MDP2867925.1 class I SAM-dependent methyltransferase [Methyloversatilis sp.]